MTYTLLLLTYNCWDSNLGNKETYLYCTLSLYICSQSSTELTKIYKGFIKKLKYIKANLKFMAGSKCQSAYIMAFP